MVQAISGNLRTEYRNSIATGAGICLLALAIAQLPLAGAVALVAGVTLLLLSLIQPLLALLFLLLLLPFGTDLGEFSLGAGTLRVPDLLTLLAVGAWLGQQVLARSLRPGRWGSVLAGTLALFWAAQTLSITVAASITASLPEIVKWGEVFLLYLAVHDQISRKPQWAVWLATALVVGASAQALLGLVQFFGRMGPPAFIILGRFVRAYGSFRQPNPFGGYMGLALPFAFSLTLSGILTKSSERPLRIGVPWFWLAAGCTLLVAAGLIASWSRGAWLGAALATLGVIIGFTRSQRAGTLAGALVLSIVLVTVVGSSGILPAAISDRLGSFLPFVGVVDVRNIKVTEANFGTLERLAHWQAALNMFGQHPWLGVGAGNYAVVYEQFRLPAWKEALGHAHNIYLNIAAESGIIGLIAYLLFVIASFRSAWAANRRATAAQDIALTAAVLGLLTHIAVHSLFDNLYVNNMYLLLAFALAVSTGLNTRSVLGSSVNTNSHVRGTDSAT